MKSPRRKRRRGYTLVFFAMLLFGIMAMAALVIDIGFARLAQRQMQTAADSAALEGLRGSGSIAYSERQDAARNFVAWPFDDDLDTTDDGKLWELCDLCHDAFGQRAAATRALETATALVPLSAAGQCVLAKCYAAAGHRELACQMYHFVLLGLTGSLLVFDHAIDEWLNPDLLLTEVSVDRQPIANLVSAAEAAHSGATKKAIAVSRPRVENGVWTVWFSAGTEDDPNFAAVHVDPYTAKITGQRIWGEDLMSWVYRLHFRLLAGETGAVIVGIAGIIVMLSIASGIYLWWPLWKNGWRAALALRKGTCFNYDLYKTTGIVSAAFLLVIAFTGVYREFPEWFKAALSGFAADDRAPAILPLLDPRNQVLVHDYSPQQGHTSGTKTTRVAEYFVLS